MKKPSLFDRCFRAADRWVARRHQCATDEIDQDMDIHVGYRCGWYAGYERARRELKQPPNTGEKS